MIRATDVSLLRTRSLRGAWSVNDKLKKEIEDLRLRIHQLECALAEVQAVVSQDPHPLLVAHRTSDNLDTSVKEEDVLEALGSLAIKENVQSFFGPTGGNEALFLVTRASIT
jgi:hypothetical protein